MRHPSKSARGRDALREVRLALYRGAGRQASITDLYRPLAAHVEARAIFAKRGDPWLARGAGLRGIVAAMQLAATPTSTEAAFEAKVRALRALLAGLDDEDAAHVSPLLDAALEAESVARTSIGLSPHGRRLSGWLDADTEPDVTIKEALQQATPDDVAPMDLEIYAQAAVADDVDLVLGLAIPIMRDLVDLSSKGRPMERALDDLVQVAFGLCAWPVPRPALIDMSGTCVILWRTLLKRRPLAAAIINARVAAVRRPATPGSPPSNA